MNLKLPHFRNKHLFALIGLGALIYIPIIILTILFFRTNQSLGSLDMSVSQVKKAQDNFKQNLSEDLFNEHLALMEKQNLQNQLGDLETELETIKETPEGSLVANINEIYDLYGDFEAKLKRNEEAKLETTDYLGKVDQWGQRIIDQDFDGLADEIKAQNDALDADYADYLATLPPPPPPPSSGYSYTNVQTEKGTFGAFVIKVPLSEVRVKTVSASASDCSDNCPVKPLAQYISENGAFAGMNGSYFCPPDYSSCGGKVNSFDYALYNSNKGKWLNKDARSWNKTGMITFKGHDYDFYKKSNEYGGGSVDAGISNYPSLLKNGEVVVNDGDLTSYQKIRGARGVIGVGGENIYLVIVSNATVEEAAYVMRALGAKHALNLDGGGSSAMYINGGYVVGPGRNLPTAVLLIR